MDWCTTGGTEMKNSSSFSLDGSVWEKDLEKTRATG